MSTHCLKQIVDESVSGETVLSSALEMAKQVAARGEDRGVYGAIKREWMAHAIERLMQQGLGEGGAFLNAKL